MSGIVPTSPKIYHIVHVDKLNAIISANELLCDSEIARRFPVGTTIGMDKIKKRRMEELKLSTHPDLFVGNCVPFYFCSRSVMLYMFHMGNHVEINYKGGQAPIIHLEADLHKVVAWANQKQKRWAFTSSNAGSRYFKDYDNLQELSNINWDAVQANSWKDQREEKQAEFLIEQSFSWHLIDRIGVSSTEFYTKVQTLLHNSSHKPKVEILGNWYY